MKRICVIGNSHAAALKTGWPLIAADFPDAELTFFAAMSQYMESLTLVGQELVATTDVLRKRLKNTSDGRSTIDNTYDAYVLCGLGVKAQIALQVHRILRAKEPDVKPEENYLTDTLPTMIAEGLRSTLAFRILGMLRQITGADVLLVPEPMFAEDGAVRFNSSPAKSENRRFILAKFQSVCERLADESRASFLPQQPDTLTADMLSTKALYARNPTALNAGTSRSDITHMNSEYGAIVLRDALEFLANAPLRDSPQ